MEREINRRHFIERLGAGLLVSVAAAPALGQRRGRGRPTTIAARIHVAADGTISVLSGKVEVGQGSRGELTQAAAEELRVDPATICMVMADTALVPDDGTTAGSRTTPATVPAVRQGAAALRQTLIAVAASRWNVPAGSLKVADGAVADEGGRRRMGYAELAVLADQAGLLAQAVDENIELTRVEQWQVMGQSLARPNGRELVTGCHKFPSDVARPGMVYGKVLRPPSYGAELLSVDLAAAGQIEGAEAFRQGDFAGCVAPTTAAVRRAVAALAATAKWREVPQISSRQLGDYLREHAQGPLAHIDASAQPAGARVLRASYQTAYIQHAPLEPRAAVAEWHDDSLIVWTGSQAPFGVRAELADEFDLPLERVRVVIPDTGSGYGGKHAGDAAVEAARLARASGRPVALRWTREEEFTWAYFRPAAVVDAVAALDPAGRMLAWEFTNVNSGASAVDTPYSVPASRCRYLPSKPPLRHGSYRALAATANTFARESFMDELALAAGIDPLDFRLAHLKEPRLRAVLEEAASGFGWRRWKRPAGRSDAASGIGLACGTEKGSVVAACVEVAVDRAEGQIRLVRVVEAFECGAIINRQNLASQVEGCIVMGLGGALTEQVRFEDGRVLNPHFSSYRVPHFADVPPIDIRLIDRPDLASAGGGETPIIAIAPAIANAVCNATSVRLRDLPLAARELRGRI